MIKHVNDWWSHDLTVNILGVVSMSRALALSSIENGGKRSFI